MIVHTHFKYCPRCASPNIEDAEVNGVRCRDCGYLYFHNTASGVAALVENDGKVLFIRRAKEPKIGMLDLPGGFVNHQESLEDALVREVREECGIEIRDLTYFTSGGNIYDYAGVRYFSGDAFFRCRPLDLSALRLSEENSECVLRDPREVSDDEIGFESARKAVRLLRKHL